MNLLIAVTDNKISQKIKDRFKANIKNKNIEYKEGILEILEDNKNIDIIILSEELPGSIGLEDLITKIKIINKKIKILILTEKNICNSVLENEKNIEIINKKNYNFNKILKKLEIKNNNIIQVSGNKGAGKTVITYIISEVILKEENKKILLIDNDIENSSLSKMYLKKINFRKLIKIKENLFLLNIKYLNKKIKINNYIQELIKKFDIIIIDSNENVNKSKYEKIVNKYIYVIEPNLIEIKKVKKNLENVKIILNKKNKNSIDKNLIEKILNKNVIGEINYSNKINKIINEGNINFLNKKEITKLHKIFCKIEKGE